MNQRTVRRFLVVGTAVLTCLTCLAVAAYAAEPAKKTFTIPSDAPVATIAAGYGASLAPTVEPPWQPMGAAKPLLLDNGPDAMTFSPVKPAGELPSPESVDAVCFQTALPQDNSTSGNARAPNNRFRFERTIYLIKASELAAANVVSGTQFSGMGWDYQTASGVTGTTGLIVYMENTADTAYDQVNRSSWTTGTATMTVVHNGNVSIPNATGTFDFNFAGAPPFTYTGGGLYIAWDATYAAPQTLSTTTVVWCNSQGLVPGLGTNQNNTAPGTTLSLSAFRPETRLAGASTSILNDAAVGFVQSYGVLPRDQAGPQTIRASLTNMGANPISNLPVTLTVTGANSHTETINIPGPIAPCGGSALATFSPFSMPNLGSSTATVTVPNDDVNTNNSASAAVDVTLTDYSFKYPGSTPAGGVGLTGPGAFVGKFTTTGPTAVTAVNLEFFSASATTYRVAIYGPGATPGAQLYLDAADRTVAAAGPVTITLPTPINVGPGTFFAGIQQTNSVNASYSFDNEAPIRAAKFYLATALPPGAWTEFGAAAANFKLNLGVTIDPCAAGAAACDDGNECTDDFCDVANGCSHLPTTMCDDHDACTADTCAPGFGCFNDPIDCNDNNACTDDSCISQALLSNACTVADDGSGTVTLPPAGCTYLSPSDVHEIINGLPPGTTIRLGAAHRDFICGGAVGQAPQGCDFTPSPACDVPGGALGGRKECADSSLQLQLQGTGSLAGWNRTINLPIGFETNVAPRTPGQPFQTFDSEMENLQGQLPPGDPDFDLLRITGGNRNGMPSPGHTTLRQSAPGGPWTVDSFFDITYRIDFIGHPGGHVGGMSGSTTATIRMTTGNGVGCVNTPTNCDDGNPCTVDACDPASGCTHTPINCDDGQICTNDTCDPSTGQCVHTATSCDDNNPCTVDSCVQALLTPACTVPDNGGGTVTLPPAGCDYLSPSDVHEIINGLPAGTTIEFGAIHKDFICHEQSGTPSVCSFTPPPGICDQPGGDLGGEQECSQSNLELKLNGTGTLAGWQRTILLPVGFETHTGPRTPGAPTQSFPTEMFRLFGQLPPGDPDFDLLRIVAGNDFGLPSPGHTTLRQQPGNQWAVDSFFDITYRIDFVGHAGGHIGGMSGSTTGTIRMQVGSGVGCVHTPVDCDDSNVCTDDSCNPTSGQCQHAPTNCDDNNACTVDSCVQGFAANPCEVAPTGGTVSLPPAGCTYLSPSDVHQIVNGLPAGTHIELGAAHRDFICRQPGGPASCSFSTADCKQGTPATGESECSDSTLQLNLHAVGIPLPDRTVVMPIGFETQTAPRTPGSPIQSFATQMFRLQGQLPPGDPDFDLLRITAGQGFGLPSPGHTTLTLQGDGNYKVDSFFDITYRIDFVGHCPGSSLCGMSGSTTGTIRMATGTGVGCVHIPGDPPGEIAPVQESKSGTSVVVTWPNTASTYDVVRGALSGLPVGPGGGDEICMSNDVAGNTLTDGFLPGIGGGVWYLVRGNNACGTGGYGNTHTNPGPPLNGPPRSTTTCP